jgi:hypothetical protein
MDRVATGFVPLLDDASAPVAQPGNGAAPVFCPWDQPHKPATKPEPAEPNAAAASEPVLTVQRNGDQITQIQIRCTCGQLIELDCRY